MVFQLVSDTICQDFGQKKNGDLIVAPGALLAITVGAWAACQLFASRTAFLLVGATIATAISANVLFWIIRDQRTVISRMKAGQPVDPVHGQRAKQPSVPNTNGMLPVLMAMLSTHDGGLYQSPPN